MGPVMSPQLMPAFASGEYVALGSKTRPDAWSHWLSIHSSAPRPREIRFYDHHFLIIEAAAAGLGVALSPMVLATDDIERERLIAPAGFDPDGSHYGLIWIGPTELSGKADDLARCWTQNAIFRLAEKVCGRRRSKPQARSPAQLSADQSAGHVEVLQ
ncbi:hypothetical protein LB532_24495 [Mesorhizobium sp. ESP-6-2]|nr:hypothetical protein [Mesorhizobium sp. ESP-6-2]